LASTNPRQKEDNVKALDLATRALIVIGGLNWGLVAVAKFDLVAWIVGLDFGQTNAASRVVYGLVGLAAVYQAAQLVGARTGEDARVRSLGHNRETRTAA
jgi:uncharacterized membrane protein YuzA (DUF378 family)